MVSAQLRFSRWRRSASALAVLSGLGLGAFGCGGGDSGPRDGGTRDSGGPPDLGDGLDAAFGFPDAEVIAPVACAPAPEVQYAASGLPRIEAHNAVRTQIALQRATNRQAHRRHAAHASTSSTAISTSSGLM